MQVKLKDIIYTVPDKKYQIKNSEIQSKGSFPVVDQSSTMSGFYDVDKCFDKGECILFADHTSRIFYMGQKFIIGCDGMKIIKIEDDLDINQKFVYFALCNNYHGDGKWRRHFGDFQNCTIDLPDRNTQDKIAEILSEIDEQINSNNEIVKRLQVLGNTIYSRIMCQPKTKILLGDIATMYQPETITSDKFVGDGKYPVYGAGGIIGFYDKCNHKDSELMLSCRGICGKAEISLPNSFIIGNQMVIKTKDEKMKYFLYNYLSNADLSKIETGSVQKQITRTNLEKMPIMLPPIETICQHSDVLKNIYDMKTKIVLENTKLNVLKTKLLPLLINGQLTI